VSSFCIVPEVDLPSGTVTFLFTDIEGSTRLLQELGERYAEVLAQHRAIIEGASAARGGHTFGTEGDALFIAFAEAAPAVLAAAESQRRLAQARWPEGREVRVRMGIHTGEATLVGTDYVGLSLHHAARLTAAGHGGQVLVSAATAGLVRERAPSDVDLRDLGEHRLRDLAGEERIYQLVAPGVPDRFPPVRTLEGRRVNLPVQLTSFVGREELAQARELLSRSHLLTLTGPGGTGKTRLALQIAAESSDEFPDGVFFVALDAVRDPDLIPSEVLRAVGLVVPGGRSPQEHLLDHVRARRMLIVLDNFEQILDGAPLVAQLLREAPELKVVVTSRVPLRIYGEQEFGVPALGVPGPDATTPEEIARYEAVRLFVERAMAAQPAFRLTPDNADAVADIVRRLDGLPLAIELAASRMRIFPVEALRARLGERLAVLTGGARDLPARQRTLRGAIDWSYDLLDDADRHLFARFAVFAGGGFLPDVEAVCGPASEIGRDVVECVDSLVEKSLLRTDPRAVHEPRFGMLATLQEYAVERLEERGEEEAERRRHALAFLSVVETTEGRLTGPEGRELLDRLEVDHDNLRAALDWAIERGEVEIALRFVAAAWRFWQIRGHLTEARQRIERVLALEGVDVQSSALQARALGAAGSIAYWLGDNTAANDHYMKALERARASGEDGAIADALYDLSFVPTATGLLEIQPELSRPYLVEALQLYERLGDRSGIAKCNWGIAIMAGGEKDLEGSLRHVAIALTTYRDIGDLFGLGWSLHLKAMVDTVLGRSEDVRRGIAEALPIFAASQDDTGIMGIILDAAVLAAREGDDERHWRLRGSVEGLRRATGAEVLFADIPALEWVLRERPSGDPEVDRAWEAGEAMTLEEAIAYALGEDPAGQLASAGREVPQAGQ
jgi:predicted ATPase/class 3 adenylate cyclase